MGLSSVHYIFGTPNIFRGCCMSAVARVASSRVAGSLNPYANLTDAGVTAADVAVAIGKARRHRELSADDRARLADVAQTLRDYKTVIDGGHYFALVSNSKTRNDLAMDTLVEVALRSLNDVDDTGSTLAKFAGEIESLAGESKQSVDEAELVRLHEYFRELSKTIRRMLTTPGESLIARSYS